MECSVMLKNHRVAVALLVFSASRPMSYAEIKPAGGERLTGGDSYTIRWNTDRAVGSVTVDLWDGRRGYWYPIVEGIDGKRGYFEWGVPTGLEGDRFRVRVTSQNGYSEISGTYFSIIPGSSVDSGAVGALTAGWNSGPVTVSSIPSVGTVTLRAMWTKGTPLIVGLYDLRGRIHRQVVGEISSAGFVDFDVASLPRGVYFVRIMYASGHIGTGQAILQ